MTPAAILADRVVRYQVFGCRSMEIPLLTQSCSRFFMHHTVIWAVCMRDYSAGVAKVPKFSDENQQSIMGRNVVVSRYLE